MQSRQSREFFKCSEAAPGNFRVLNHQLAQLFHALKVFQTLIGDTRAAQVDEFQVFHLGQVRHAEVADIGPGQFEFDELAKLPNVREATIGEAGAFNLQVLEPFQAAEVLKPEIG